METAGYTALSRQTGLLREMRVIANNIANANTTGFRQEGVVFSEYVRNADAGASVAMTAGRVRNTSFLQGTLEKTDNAYDVAIEGDGYFLIGTPNGERLTRAGAFSPSAEGTLVTSDGNPVLDIGGAPVFVPSADDFAIGQDGTLSAQGRAFGQLGIVRPIDPTDMVREGGVLFNAEGGFEPVDDIRVLQGFVESSNVNPILQVARMVEVQRAYEMSQSFLEQEDERVRAALKAFVK